MKKMMITIMMKKKIGKKKKSTRICNYIKKMLYIKTKKKIVLLIYINYFFFINIIITFNLLNITFYSPLPLSNKEPRDVLFFPLSTNVIWKYDNNLWAIIGEYTDPLFYESNDKFYDLAVDALNTIPSLDIRFAALIEFGHAVYLNGTLESYNKVYKYLKEIINDRDPNILFAGLENYIKVCQNSQGTLINVMRLIKDIKDKECADEELKNLINYNYNIFMENLKRSSKNLQNLIF